VDETSVVGIAKSAQPGYPHRRHYRIIETGPIKPSTAACCRHDRRGRRKFLEAVSLTGEVSGRTLHHVRASMPTKSPRQETVDPQAPMESMGSSRRVVRRLTTLSSGGRLGS